MDIRVLRYFLAVAREENITRAAESLHMAQPSLSKQLMDLEQELGKRLFIRGKRRITLTEDGVLLRKRADEIVALLEKTEHELSADSEIISGEVSIGGGTPEIILQAIGQIRKEQPEVTFDLFSGDAIDVLERLNHGSLDFAILIGEIDSMKYESLLLPGNFRWGVLMKKGNPLSEKPYISREDLLEIPLIQHKRVGVQREISLWARTAPEHLHVVATYNVLYGNILSYVRNGIGNLLLLEDHLVNDSEQDVCFRPLYPPLETQYTLVWKRYQMFGKGAEYFLNKVRSITKET